MSELMLREIEREIDAAIRRVESSRYLTWYVEGLETLITRMGETLLQIVSNLRNARTFSPILDIPERHYYRFDQDVIFVNGIIDAALYHTGLPLELLEELLGAILTAAPDVLSRDVRRRFETMWYREIIDAATPSLLDVRAGINELMDEMDYLIASIDKIVQSAAKREDLDISRYSKKFNALADRLEDKLQIIDRMLRDIDRFEQDVISITKELLEVFRELVRESLGE